MAAWKGHTTVVQKLLAAGAAINTAEVSGMTPLMLAVTGKHLETVQVLIEAGADPRLADKDGRTARDLAADNPDIGNLLQLP
jgi:ankyrin repeat protein